MSTNIKTIYVEVAQDPKTNKPDVVPLSCRVDDRHSEVCYIPINMSSESLRDRFGRVSFFELEADTLEYYWSCYAGFSLTKEGAWQLVKQYRDKAAKADQEAAERNRQRISRESRIIADPLASTIASTQARLSAYMESHTKDDAKALHSDLSKLRGLAEQMCRYIHSNHNL